jgi:hypothetical protein
LTDDMFRRIRRMPAPSHRESHAPSGTSHLWTAAVPPHRVWPCHQ